MAPLQNYIALASVLLLQISCVFSDTLNINFVTTISNCSPDGWSLVDSKSLPLTEYISDKKVLKSGPLSCASFVINVTPGNLELSVYLEEDSESRIEVLVRDNDGSSIINYVYGKSNIDFERGWHTITLSIDKETTAHVTLLGVSQSNEDVIVKSIKYNDNQNLKSTWTRKLGDVKIIDLLSNKKETNLLLDQDLKSELEGEDENLSVVSPEAPNPDSTDDEENGPDESTDAPNPGGTDDGENGPDESTDAPNPGGTDDGENGPDESTDAPNPGGTDDGENGPDESTDAPNPGGTDDGENGPDESTDAPNPGGTDDGENEPDESTDAPNPGGTDDGENGTGGSTEAPNPDSTDDGQNGSNPTGAPGESTEEPNDEASKENNNSNFWNVWTIALVAVASGSFVALVVVGAYHLGKNSRGVRDTPIDLSDFEAPRIIPRAKTAFPPYQRFGGSDYGYGSQKGM